MVYVLCIVVSRDKQPLDSAGAETWMLKVSCLVKKVKYVHTYCGHMRVVMNLQLRIEVTISVQS